jgi:PAS domain S-box-containing protein
MKAQAEHSAGEIKHLERCINDLVSLLALPAVWTGGDPSQVLHTLLDALIRMLSLDLVSVQLKNPGGETPVEIVKVAELRGPIPPAHDICEALSESLKSNSRKWPALLRNLFGDEEVSIVALPLGLQGELGVMVAASRRADFPRETEGLLLSVAANQAAIGLQEARLRSQQRRVADELDERVAQRTAELADANAELQLQVGLLQLLPVSAWTLKPDGTPDFVNQVWLEYSGQTVDFVRSHPEAWMTAVHPEDRAAALRSFWEGVHSGQDFAFETRSLRAQDGTYRWHLQQAVVLRDAEGKVLKFVGTTTDIDDQKRAQEVLQASEGKLQRVIDTIPTLVWCNLPDGPNEFLSKSWHEYTGLSPEEAHGWGWSAAFHPDDLPPLMKRWQELLVSGEPGEIEARLRRHDGEYRWFLIRVAPFRNHTGAIERWYGTSTDIDDRKRAEEKLRASESSLRQVFDSIPGMVFALDPTGQIELSNRRHLEYFGKTLDELNAWATNDAIHPDDLPRATVDFKLSMTTGTPFESELRYRRADGVYRWFQGRSLPVRDTDGRIARWYSLITDIDDRKRAEEKLRRSEALLAQVQTVSVTGGFSWRVETKEITWSEQLYDIFEFDESTPPTIEKVYSRVHPDDVRLLQEAVERAQRDGSNIDLEHRLLMPNHSVKYLNMVAHATRDKDGRLEFVGAVQDVTRRRLSEEALNKARSELAHVSRVTTLGALTASIAHEVNQPLSGIITNASTCLRMLAADPPQVEGARETARRTIRDGNRMSEVISRLRELFSKKEPTTESVNLNEAVLEVIALSIVELQKNHVMLRPELTGNLPLVAGDRVQLQQVVLNLLKNGSDAMSGVEDRPRLLVIKTERDEGDRVRLTVRDAGVGFDPQAVEQLFDAFYTTKGDGMGIGLSVSRSIIERHNGRLWATLNEGPGATFSFSIPRASEGLARGDSVGNIQAPGVTGTA